MRIIQGLTAAEAVPALAAAMIEIESGKGPDAVTVIKPETKTGRAYESHHRPTVGVIFWAAAGAGTAAEVYRAAVEKIEPEVDHLPGYKVVRPLGSIAEGMNVFTCFEKVQQRLLPKRGFMSDPGGGLPLSHSDRAVFMWYFVEARGALASMRWPQNKAWKIGLDTHSMRALGKKNAAHASIFLDLRGVLKPDLKVQARLLRYDDFLHPPPAPVFPSEPVQRGAPLYLLRRSGEIEVVGCGMMYVPQPRRAAPPPMVDWKAGELVNERLGLPRCAVCRWPYWGEVYIVRDVRIGARAIEPTVICRYCAVSLPATAINMNRAVCPRSQLAALESDAKFAPLAKMLKRGGRARPLTGCPRGVFIVGEGDSAWALTTFNQAAPFAECAWPGYPISVPLLRVPSIAVEK